MSVSRSVTFEDVVKRYGGGTAVAGVTLEIAGGSFVALVGGSGAGKSTLLRMVNRLVIPDEGRISIDGRDVAGISAPAVRRGIGYVFQDVGLFPHMSVAENIAIAARIGGGAAPDVGAELERVGLPRDYAARMPAQLSGGQRQRVGVARALAGGASLMLLDEPFGALDPVTRDALARGYRDLHDRLELTTIMVTHDMAEALLMADRIVVMAKGVVVADATPKTMLAGEAGEEAAALVAVPARQAEALEALRGG
ncbi:MAG: ATP-binding cassette domain-containing protein [Sphingomonadaceae bacterium]|nr:ATP-binding cassette domain-containing protein [Sphingomonadaceae bacterium]